MVHKLKPRFISLPPHCEAGGLGGSAKPIILADVPTGLASVNGVSRWLVVEDTSMENRVPPLIPIKLLKHLDSVIETKAGLITLRIAEDSFTVKMVDLTSDHQTMSMMHFSDDGWALPVDESDMGDSYRFYSRIGSG